MYFASLLKTSSSNLRVSPLSLSVVCGFGIYELVIHIKKKQAKKSKR